ncbi:MAG TPA: hypothetical protein DDY31_08570 [Lachnospiraceae bacterium]|nr:hypothetical protein [Lachnospiraceae bacterium]
MGTFKNALKRILPPPVNSFMREVNRIISLEEKNQAMIQQLTKRVEQQEKVLQKQIEKIDRQEQKFVQLLDEVEKKDLKILEKSLEQQSNVLQHIKEQQNIIKKDTQAARVHAWQGQKNGDEIIWAEIFNNVISNSSWLTNKSFSAGRWAVGYQYLYVVYRILNEVRPKNILELGLGQSTRLFGQYAASDVEVQHIVVEHDPTWIQFFQQDFQLPSNSTIIQLEREYRVFREDDHVLAFKNFKETFVGEKFDFISIDAPLGGEAVIYARVDILELLPDVLADSFIIVVDDFNRQGEKNTVAVLEEILQENGILYVKGVYAGKKDCIVICSEDLKYVKSM